MSLRTSLKRFFIVAVLAFVALVVVGCVNNDEAKEFAEKIQLADVDEIKGTFPLPKYVQGNKETSVTWTSDKPNIILIEEFPTWDKSFDATLYFKAKVVLPEDAETVVKLTANVTFGKQKATREFDLTVVKNDYKTMTVAEAKVAKAKEDKVMVTGVVTFVGEGGYVLKDDTGSIYIYKGKGVAIGDKMAVRGLADNYQKMPQVAFDSQEQVDKVAFDQAAEAVTMELKDIPNHDNKDLAFYSKLVKVSGIVKPNTDANMPYKIVNPLNFDEFVLVNKYTSAKSIESLKANVEKYIEIIAVIYDNRNNVFNLILPDTFTGTVFSYTDQQNADMALAALKEKWSGALVTGDVTLDAKVAAYGADVTWTSSDTAIFANDGKVNLPDNDTTITLTIVTSIPGKTATATGTVEITVKKLPPVKINTLIEKTPAKTDDPKITVVFEGVVIGHQYKGYWVADETGAILVFTNKVNSAEQPFPAIGKMLSVKGELTTFGEANSFTSQINPVDVKEITGTAPQVIAPVTMTFDQIFGLSIDTYAKAKDAGKTYYGKFITITGKVSGSGNFWQIVNESNPDQFFRLNNLAANTGLVKDQVVTITVMVRDFYFIDDTSTYNNFKKGVFGGVFFIGENVIVPKQ